jgi:Holliday junction resolvasome RuvABC endonuclease subunit
MTILALDLGTKTGWACGTSHVKDSGTENFAQGKFAGGGMRFLAFERWLDKWVEGDGVTEVVFEAVRRHIGTDAAHIYGGLLAILTKWCEARGIPYQGIPVQTIKKHATGKGNAKKDAMMEAVRRWGFSPKDDNEADAIALLSLRINGEVLS